MNLPLLIDLIMTDADKPIAETIENALKVSREQIVYVNKLINKENAHD